MNSLHSRICFVCVRDINNLVFNVSRQTWTDLCRGVNDDLYQQLHQVSRYIMEKRP